MTTTPSKPRRGVVTIADLKVRSIVDPLTHCWHWQHAMSGGNSAAEAVPKIHTFDHARGEKRVMSGPVAVWNIAHQAAPNAPLVFRACGCGDCVNPAHLRLARTRAEIGLHQQLSGSRKGKHMEVRRVSAAKGRVVLGIVDTDREIVRAIQAAPLDTPRAVLSTTFGVSKQLVTKFRGQARRAAAIAEEQFA